jgi:U3 small nucleolar RNA-associated protein 20
VTVDTHLDEELLDTESHFYGTLQHQRQLNLAPAFLRFANNVDRLSQTLPLLVLNAEQIVKAWIQGVDECAKGEEGLKAMLEYVLLLHCSCLY